MSIVTFWNGTNQQCGNTSSAVAVATQMAIDHNMKILLISTSLNDRFIQECYWHEKKKILSNIFGVNVSGIEKNGIEGLDRVLRSNKISPDIITDYTKVVLANNRLDVLLGMEDTGGLYDTTKTRYPEIIELASQFYDTVIVDLDKRLGKYQEDILKMSDVVVAVLPQREAQITCIKDLIESGKVVNKNKTIMVIGKYMENNKYNARNITRSILKQKNTVNVIPYNNLYFEASQEGKVVDLFLNLMRIKEKDENYNFILEVKNLIDEIQMKAQVLK